MTDTIGVGQIGIVAGPSSRVQWFISAFTQSLAVHVVINRGDGTVVSAMPDGVIIEPLDAYKGAIWSRFPYGPGQGEAVVAFAMEQRGKKYNYVDDGMIGIEYLTGWNFPTIVTNVVDNGKRWQCSQLADAALCAGYKDLFPAVDGRIAPGTFAKLYEAEGWWPDNIWSGHTRMLGK